MKPRFVAFHYTLKDKTGKVLDTSGDGEPMMVLEGANQMLPGLEAGLKELKVGDKKQIKIPAAEAYGTRDESLVVEVPLTRLPTKDPIRAGLKFRLDSQKNGPQIFRVIRVSSNTAVLDGNHELAGQDLFFDVEVKDIRDAMREEVEFSEDPKAMASHRSGNA
jgi:FKBP-type peptidyl-prolyl cis-trans isomerase SlyD